MANQEIRFKEDGGIDKTMQWSEADKEIIINRELNFKFNLKIDLTGWF